METLTKANTWTKAIQSDAIWELNASIGERKETLLDQDTSFGRSEGCVRINALDTREMALRDLEAVLPFERLDAIVIPKVEKASDINVVSQMMDSMSPTNRDVRIIAAVESALGMLNLREIAATQGRLDALVFASEDYCADFMKALTPTGMVTCL